MVGQTWQIRRPSTGLPEAARDNLRGLPRPALRELLAQRHQLPGYRGDQIFRWIHREDVDAFAQMSNLPKALREQLEERYSIERLTVDTVLHATDGTFKLRLETVDGRSIESVLIPNDDRAFTLCISSQVGCALDCRFCATASLGFHRHLHTWEIADQVARARALLAERLPDQSSARVGNIVYMGMGEPLHNFNHVRDSLAILMDEEGTPLSGKRITVSTSGLVPAIERFAREGLGQEVGLAISLNATTDDTRDEVMPINRKWNIERLLTAVREVPTSRRRRVTFEYVLLADVNDSGDDARRLIKLLREFRCHVNVIPFNPHAHAPYRRPQPQRVAAFTQVLRDAGLRVYLRTPRGDDIGAACGQLALDGGSSSEGPAA